MERHDDAVFIGGSVGTIMSTLAWSRFGWSGVRGRRAAGEHQFGGVCGAVTAMIHRVIPNTARSLSSEISRCARKDMKVCYVFNLCISFVIAQTPRR